MRGCNLKAWLFLEGWVGILCAFLLSVFIISLCSSTVVITINRFPHITFPEGIYFYRHGNYEWSLLACYAMWLL
jgi:hypothetical protein